MDGIDLGPLLQGQTRIAKVKSRAANEYEAVLACTRVHFKNSVTREVLYYRHVIKRLCKICYISAFPSHNIN